MKGKYYTFKEGQSVPEWLFKADFERMERKDHFHNTHHGKIIFGRSCVVVRGDNKTYSKIMPAMNTYGLNHVIRILKFKNAVLGGVHGATGVAIPQEGTGVFKISADKSDE